MAPSQFLKAFGLSDPGVRRWQSEPPQYMLNLYTQVADSSGLTRLPGPYGSSIIRAYSEKGKASDPDSIFSFLLNEMSLEEDVLEVEFHFYHSRLTKEQRHNLQENIYKLEVYQVGELKQQVLTKQHIAAHSSGWRVLRLGQRVVASGTKLQEGRLITLEVKASTLSGRRLPIVLHHEARGSRQPLLILFNSLIPTTTLHALPRFQGNYLRI
ncbi:hypothetical protein Pcinc_019475 [Petrolisthes cinctipes]|uniref:Uncharacterized protein n=1 Tax=Petrolisthes cinctipes TaxID=88211 RepID=A0AAE1FL44_PETCI|nr:hypothetical protein Pcinc_019475 [Petrolisthes cinctipes]